MQEKDSSSQNVNISFPLIITSLTPLGKGGKFRLTFSDNTILILFKEIIVDEILSIDMQITENDYLRLCRKQEYETTIRKGLNLLARRAHSEREMRQKLFIKGFSEVSINNAILFYYRYNYLDDEEFSRQWIASRIKKTGYSRSRIIQELFKKGISRNIINTVTNEILSDEYEYDACRKYYEKVQKRSSFSESKSVQILSAKGFSWTVIKKVLKPFRN